MKMSMIRNLSVDLLEKATLVWTEVNQLTPLTDESFVYPPEEYQNRPRRIIDPTPAERREILSIFKQEGAIKVLHEYTYGRREVPYKWLIEVINPRFNELKSEIKELYESKAEESLKEAGITWGGQQWSQQDQVEWSDDFRWEGDTFFFGEYGNITFSDGARKPLFKSLTEAKGNWVTVANLAKQSGKEVSYVRPTINMIEQRLTPKLAEHVSIPPRREPAQGAYRIKFTFNPQTQTQP